MIAVLKQEIIFRNTQKMWATLTRSSHWRNQTWHHRKTDVHSPRMNRKCSSTLIMLPAGV